MDLHRNEIGDEGCKMIGANLVHVRKLHTLDLHRNEIGAEERNNLSNVDGVNVIFYNRKILENS